MNSAPDLPVIKNPEPFSVLPLLEKWIEEGAADWMGMQMFWLGHEAGRQHYLLTHSEKPEINLFVVSVLSEDEKIIFRGFQDWYSQAIRKLSEVCRGYFTFDVLQFEIGDAPLSWNDFTNLLKAHALKLGVGENRLIQFSGLWGVLTRRTEADFGRVESKLNLEFCKPSPEACARLIKKQAAKLPPHSQTMLVFRDLSRSAICPNEFTDEFLSGLFCSGLTGCGQAIPFIYFNKSSERCLRAGLHS